MCIFNWKASKLQAARQTKITRPTKPEDKLGAKKYLSFGRWQRCACGYQNNKITSDFICPECGSTNYELIIGRIVVEYDITWTYDALYNNYDKHCTTCSVNLQTVEESKLDI